MGTLLSFRYGFAANGFIYDVSVVSLRDAPAQYEILVFRTDPSGNRILRAYTDPPLETEWSHAFEENDGKIIEACRELEDIISNSGW